MQALPQRRQTGILIQEVGNEILVYDLNVNQVFVLNEVCGKIYLACDGRTTLEEVTRAQGLVAEVVLLALDELWQKNLLEPGSSEQPGIDRRVLLKKLAVLSLAMLPGISSVAAPTAAAAASAAIPLYGPCLSGTGCAPGLTCRLCHGCPSLIVDIRACCVVLGTGLAFGSGVVISTCATGSATCNTLAADGCCSGIATFTVTNCGGPGSGPCVCD